MTKFKKLAISIFILGVVTITCFSMMNKSYSYGASSYITGENGNYTLQFYDIDSGVDISCSAAQEFYGMTKYQKKKKSGTYYYFYNCKQTSESTYENNYPKELADIRVRDKGDSAYRVSSTATAKQAYDHIYQNHRTGKFTLEFASNETIDWDAVEDYVMQKYGVTNYKTNYYSYAVKGEWEPIRYSLPNKSQVSTGSIEIDMWRMRITGDELKVTEAFVNKLLPLLKGNGTEYEKVLASYQYLKQYTKYLTDTGFNNGVDSNTSVYDAFIERQTTCIGYSIAFSYLMDKLGVESYIVDQISFNNPSTEEFGSVHTYNIVKVDGKFYKLDLTGGAFLTGLTSSTLSDSKLPISTSKYNTSGKKTTWSFNKATIDSYLSSAKATKTTTTKKIVQTTTKMKTTSVKVDNNTTSTTKKKTTSKETTTTTKKPTTKTSTTTSKNTSAATTTTTTNKYSKPTTKKQITQIITYTVTNTHGQTEIRTSIKTVTTTTKTNRPQKTKKTTTNKKGEIEKTTVLTEEELQIRKEKATINMFLFCIGITVIIVYLTYRSYKLKQKSRRYDQEVDDILRNYRGR